MAPFYYQGERLLGLGEVETFGAGPKKSRVEVLGDDFALVTPSEGRSVYVGKTDSTGKRFKGLPSEAKGRVLLHRESVGVNFQRPNVVWRKK